MSWDPIIVLYGVYIGQNIPYRDDVTIQFPFHPGRPLDRLGIEGGLSRMMLQFDFHGEELLACCAASRVRVACTFCNLVIFLKKFLDEVNSTLDPVDRRLGAVSHDAPMILV